MTWQSNEQACCKSNICLKLQSNTTTINLETMKMYSKNNTLSFTNFKAAKTFHAHLVGIVDVVRVVGEVAVSC